MAYLFGAALQTDDYEGEGDEEVTDDYLEEEEEDSLGEGKTDDDTDEDV